MSDQFKQLKDAADLIEERGQNAFIDLRIVPAGIVLEGYLSWDRAPAPSFSRVVTWKAIEGRPHVLNDHVENMIGNLKVEFGRLRNRSSAT